MEALNSKLADERQQKKNVRFFFPFGYEDYKVMLSRSADVILARRHEKISFVIDRFNEPFVRQLYYYLTFDNRFEGILQKGIMLIGKYGTGKTLIMQAMAEMYRTVVSQSNLYHPMITFIKSTALIEELKNDSISNYSKRPLIIDEFGREPKQIMHYGNWISPLIELLNERYDNGAWTHGTSNFTYQTLKSDDMYGEMTGDRIKAMFNFIELKGESRRK
jgi:DNA replication protein DnaC